MDGSQKEVPASECIKRLSSANMIKCGACDSDHHLVGQRKCSRKRSVNDIVETTLALSERAARSVSVRDLHLTV